MLVMLHRLTVVAASVCLVLGAPGSVRAQRADSVRAGPAKPPAPAPAQRTATREVTKPPISPGHAFLYSLALPGLGQSRLRRSGAGATYFLFEGVSFAMATKSLYDLRIAKEHRADSIPASYQPQQPGQTGDPTIGDVVRNRYSGNRVRARRTHVEDWVTALIFNHLFSGADAYVSAQLWDLPIQLGFRAAPAIGMLRAASRY